MKWTASYPIDICVVKDTASCHIYSGLGKGAVSYAINIGVAKGTASYLISM
jgi:hypothetical protein